MLYYPYKAVSLMKIWGLVCGVAMVLPVRSLNVGVGRVHKESVWPISSGFRAKS